jgi:GNAT superfamily N-acetyltransferase
MELTFFPFEGDDTDYQFLETCWNEVYPEFRRTVEEIRFDDSFREEKYYFQRFIILQGHERIGVCNLMEPGWSYRKGKVFFNWLLLPKVQDQGLDRQVLNFLFHQAEPLEPNWYTTNFRENETEKKLACEARGFNLAMRYPISYLDVRAFDLSPYEPLIEKLISEGVRLTSGAELLEADPDFLTKWYEMEWELVQDLPFPDTLTRRTYAQFVKLLDAPSFFPEGHIFAVEGSDLVGVSGLWKSQSDPSLLVTSLTGVVRSHRRRKIATAMKVEAVRVAKAYGAERIETDNEEHNPMLQLNLKLGFVPVPAFVDYQLKLESADG